jgi:malonyl-CoA O-methyltransferase
VKEQAQQSEVIREFSRFAHTYDSYNQIQQKVAKSLVASISTDNYDRIIDIGCGSGSVYQNLKIEKKLVEEFIALDSSEDMLAIHPNGIDIKKICTDFDSKDAFETIIELSGTLLISASALQWSKNLDTLFSRLSQLGNQAYFAIFTANTFKTLHGVASLNSPIYSTNILTKYINKYFDASYEVQNYQLEFESVKEMFRYIKKSGVSGGEKKLSYNEIKSLMDKYPLKHLEFEVLFVKATSLKRK